MEEWKDVIGFEGLYQVSNTGEVKSLGRISSNKGSYSGCIKVKEIYLKQSITRLGYHVLTLFKDGRRHFKIVHRIVAEAFIENPKGYLEVNHKDLDKSNNTVLNLEWCDRIYNMNHMFENKIKSSKYKGVSYSKERDKWCAYINILGKKVAIGRYNTEEEAKQNREEFIIKLKNTKHEELI
jgi:hypothetical protein